MKSLALFLVLLFTGVSGEDCPWGTACNQQWQRFKSATDEVNNPKGAEMTQAMNEKPSRIRTWKELDDMDADPNLKNDPDFVKNANDWDENLGFLEKNGDGNLDLKDANGVRVGEIKDGVLIPDDTKYDYSPGHDYTGTEVGTPVNGYQFIVKSGNRRLLRRVPDQKAYSEDQLSALTDHPKAHTLQRHGHDVPDEALVKRAKTPSYAPDGKQNPLPPGHSSKFESPTRLAEALDKVGPNSPSWNPPANPSNGQTYSRFYTDPNNTPFGYGVPAGQGLSSKVQMHKVEAFYNYQATTGKWELSTMYPAK